MEEKILKKCELCGKEFEPNKKKKRYCQQAHDVVCFGCGKTFTIKKPKAGVSIDRYTCGDYKCRTKLTQQTNMEKYGVKNVAQRKEVQDKMKKTTLERFGVEHAFQSEKIKEKIKETNVEKYGTEHPRWHNEESRKKAEQTNIEKYGHVNPFGGEKIKEKIQQGNLDKYGVLWTTQAEEVKSKMRDSYIKNFGVDNPAKAKEVQNKMRATNLKRYGSESFMSSEIGQEKFSQEIFKKYGVYNISHIGITNYEEYLNLEEFLKNTDKSITEIAEYFNLPRRRIRKRIIDLGLQEYFEDLYVNSVKEDDFEQFLKNDEYLKNIEYMRNNRTVLEGKELDFYFPNHKLAVEISPTYTHNSKTGWGGKTEGVSSRYHIHKFLECEKQGIELLTIFDWHDWDKVLEMIKSKLKGSTTKLYARNTEYLEYSEISKELFEKISSWHILDLPSNIKRKTTVSVLTHNEEIVGIALWGSITNGTVELKRLVFKPDTTVSGGASKLIKNYYKNREEVKEIFTYSDCDLGTGSVYEKIGFTMIEQSTPVLTYYNTKQEMHVKHLSLVRQGADRLLKNFPGYKPVGMGENLPSNREIIESYGFLPVYDCGYKKWSLKVN